LVELSFRASLVSWATISGSLAEISSGKVPSLASSCTTRALPLDTFHPCTSSQKQSRLLLFSQYDCLGRSGRFATHTRPQPRAPGKSFNLYRHCIFPTLKSHYTWFLDKFPARRFSIGTNRDRQVRNTYSSVELRALPKMLTLISRSLNKVREKFRYRETCPRNW